MRGGEKVYATVSVRKGITAAAIPTALTSSSASPSTSVAPGRVATNGAAVARNRAQAALRLGDRERPEDELVDAEQDDDVHVRIASGHSDAET